MNSEQRTMNNGKRVKEDEFLLFVLCSLLFALCFGACELGEPVAPPSYTVVYNANGGSGSMAHSTHIYGTDQNLNANAFSRTNFGFAGWADSSYGAVKYTDTQSVKNLTQENGAVVTLYAVWTHSGTPVPGSSLAEKLAWMATNALSDVDYAVEVNADEDIDPTLLSYEGRTNIGVTLIGTGAERIIGLSSTGSLFTVSDGVTLTLENDITLRGRSNNNASLVRVNVGGTLITNARSRITGNTFSSYSFSGGGGVYVGSNGIFTMHGGEISGNTASSSSYSSYSSYSYGGGVSVGNSGTFTMHGGEISGNIASSSSSYSSSSSSYGGGVYVSGTNATFTMHGGEISGNTASSYSSYGGGVYVSSGTFRIVTGTIYGSNEADTSLRNSSPVGAALCWNSGTVEFGTFSGDTWDSNGNLITTDDTIRVVNGVLSGVPQMPDNYVFNVATTVEWNTALSSIATYGSNKNYTINVTADFSVDGRNYAIFGSARTVTLRGPGRTLSLSGNGRILYIGSNQSVIFYDLILRGHSANNASLVYVTGTNATFTMNGGEISGSSGRGVSVSNSGTFTMHGGEISGNTGGGVYVGDRGTFRIVTGTIYGSTEADTSLRNAGALYVGSGGTAEFGTFSGDTWNSNGTLYSTEVAILVVNGELLTISPWPDNYVFNVGTTAEWNNALSSIAVYGSNKNYTINVTADFSVGGRNYAIFGGASDVTVTLRGPGRTLSLSGNGSILYIGSNQSVIFYDLILRGHSANNASLVYVTGTNATFTMHGGEISSNTAGNGGGVRVSGGTFTMHGGEISGNTASFGGGVYVYPGTFTMHGGEISGNTASPGGGVSVEGGTFTMNGGVISGNTASLGGGVCINPGTFTMNGGEISGNIGTGTNISFSVGGVFVGGGTFTMNGGEISGNRASSFGGGVYASSGTFRIVTGTIYGSDEADTSLRNTASAGAALYRSSGTAQFGTFSGETWNSNGTLGTTDETIRVVEGVLLSPGGITPMPDNHVFNVGTTTEWNNALSSIVVYGSNKNYTINVTADFSVDGRNYDTFGGASGVTVTLSGTGRTLSLSGNGSILRIGSNQSVLFYDLTLKGHSSNNASLVYVSGTNATFTMNSGVISGNTASSYGGGVYVYSGTFTMNSGVISGNTASSYGGGVYVYSGTFTMNSGVISGNTASSYGGGVYVDGGTFTMGGGEISGNTAYYGGGVYMDGRTFRIVTGIIYGSDEADASLRNTATNGAALRSSGTAQYGTFSGSTWNSNGNLGTTDDTIRVVEGVLIQ